MRNVTNSWHAFALAVLLGLLAMVLGAGPALGGIAGTKHDLSQKGFNTTQICIFCHTPHNANAYVPGSPLWNHNVTWSTFTTYASPTLNAVPGQPTGTSKLCLSCHDGTVGIDAYTNNAGLNFITGTALLGTDLSNDHPVSFLYDAALATADKGLITPVDDKYVDAAHKLPLFSGQLQCASCHQVHDDTNGKFLRMSNSGSMLCLTCHLK